MRIVHYLLLRYDYAFNEVEKWNETIVYGHANFTIPFTYMDVGVYEATIEAINEVCYKLVA